MAEIPKDLRKRGIQRVTDNVAPGQVLDPKHVAKAARIFFKDELIEFLTRYQERQENTPCQVSDPNTAGSDSPSDSCA